MDGQQQAGAAFWPQGRDIPGRPKRRTICRALVLDGAGAGRSSAGASAADSPRVPGPSVRAAAAARPWAHRIHVLNAAVRPELTASATPVEDILRLPAGLGGRRRALPVNLRVAIKCLLRPAWQDDLEFYSISTGRVRPMRLFVDSGGSLRSCGVEYNTTRTPNPSWKVLWATEDAFQLAQPGSP